MIEDMHTHTPRPGAVWNADPVERRLANEEIPPQVDMFSVGIHPWNTLRYTEADWQQAQQWAADARCVAIGEAGFDPSRPSNGTPQQQETLLRRHIELSERLGKPLILHLVRSWQRIMDLHRELRPTQMWIVHGFRGKPELARQLVRAGFGLSFGPDADPAVMAEVPPERLFRETD